MVRSRVTSAPLAKANAAPPLVPHGGEVDHVEFLGLPFCLLTQAEVVDAITSDCGAPYRYVVTPNAYHVVAAHDEPARMLPIYRAAAPALSFDEASVVRR